MAREVVEAEDVVDEALEAVVATVGPTIDPVMLLTIPSIPTRISVAVTLVVTATLAK